MPVLVQVEALQDSGISSMEQMPISFMDCLMDSLIPTAPEPNLKSEYTISKEAGIQLVMFGSRLNLDFAIYQTGTKNQIFSNPLTPSSGFNSGFINSGFVNNSGVEIAASYILVQKPDLKWSVEAISQDNGAK
jgi:outer membrane receptor protein involved in Fe transport